MKSLYLALFLLVTTTAGFAQRSINVKLLATRFSLNWPLVATDILDSSDTLYYNGVTKHHFIWVIEFLGPDSLMQGDTVHFKNTGGYWRLPVDSFIAAHLSVYDTIGLIPIPWVILPMPTPPQTPPQFWTDSVWVTSGPSNTPITDPYLPDNENTTPVVASMQYPGSVEGVQFEAALNIYPNPAVGILNIELDLGSTTGMVSVMLTDMTARAVYQRSSDSLNGKLRHTIDVSNLPPGMYIAEVQYEGKRIVSKVSVR